MGQIFVNKVANRRRGRNSSSCPSSSTLGGEFCAHPWCGGNREQREPHITKINHVECEAKQQGNSKGRFDESLPILALETVLWTPALEAGVHVRTFSAGRAVSKSIESPIEVRVAFNVPAGSSKTAAALQKIRVTRNGRTRCLTATTVQSPFRTAMSMGNCIPQVCTA